MTKREHTRTELGMICGTLVGASIALVMFTPANDAWWLSMTGASVAVGLGIGASMDKSAG